MIDEVSTTNTKPRINNLWAWITYASINVVGSYIYVLCRCLDKDNLIQMG